MLRSRRLLNGETLVLDVPDASALPGSTAISVLSLGEVELEINAGNVEDLDFYLSLSGTELTGALQIRTGTTLRHGRHGGDPAAGIALAMSVGEHEVYGITVPSTDLEMLAAHLADIELVAHPDGPSVRTGGTVAWSAYRTHSVAQAVDLGAGEGYLLDLRRTRSGQAPTSGAGGLQARGGLLSRSSPQERHAYAILESADFLSYGIPGEQTDLDLVASSLAGVRTDLG